MLVTKAERIGCTNLNRLAAAQPSGLVELSEAAYAGALAMVCRDVLVQQRQVILLTGPSGSGKTTTAFKLMDLLRRYGRRAVGISLDSFYLPHNMIPKWDNDRPNFETVEALDLDYIAKCVRELEHDRATRLPVYAFSRGGRQPETTPLTMDENTVLVVEGIHALNPRLTSLFTAMNAEKLYVSAHTDFVDDQDNFVLMAQDLRLLRRLMRDLVERGVPLSETLGLWDDVCRGERAYIRPYRANADVHINSTHSYEPLLYKPIFLSLLAKHPQPAEYAPILERLTASLAHFGSLPGWMLPRDSLIREFLPSTEP